MYRANMDTLTERSANTLRPTRVQISKTTPELSRVLISSHVLHRYTHRELTAPVAIIFHFTDSLHSLI